MVLDLWQVQLTGKDSGKGRGKGKGKVAPASGNPRTWNGGGSCGVGFSPPLSRDPGKSRDKDKPGELPTLSGTRVSGTGRGRIGQARAIGGPQREVPRVVFRAGFAHKNLFAANNMFFLM